MVDSDFPHLTPFSLSICSRHPTKWKWLILVCIDFVSLQAQNLALMNWKYMDQYDVVFCFFMIQTCLSLICIQWLGTSGQDRGTIYKLPGMKVTVVMVHVWSSLEWSQRSLCPCVTFRCHIRSFAAPSSTKTTWSDLLSIVNEHIILADPSVPGGSLVYVMPLQPPCTFQET